MRSGQSRVVFLILTFPFYSNEYRSAAQFIKNGASLGIHILIKYIPFPAFQVHQKAVLFLNARGYLTLWVNV